MAFELHIITLAPDIWPVILGEGSGLVGRACASGKVALKVWDLREFGQGTHRKVDDTPYGGGAGMILKVDTLHACLQAVRKQTPAPAYLLGPRGRPLAQAAVQDWSKGPGLVLVCGRYEGVDERIREFLDGEICVGDAVLSAGDPAAWCVADAVIRLLPGVLGNSVSTEEESFAQGLLEYPHYTRPVEYQGRKVPEVLMSGDHGAIRSWRQAQAKALTQSLRPDLLD